MIYYEDNIKNIITVYSTNTEIIECKKILKYKQNNY